MINQIPIYGLYSIAARSFTKSSILNKILRRSVNYPESGSIVQINNEESITHLVLNKILLSQNLYVTKSKLIELLKVKGVEINLPVVGRSQPEDKTLLA